MVKNEASQPETILSLFFDMYYFCFFLVHCCLGPFLDCLRTFVSYYMQSY